MDHARRAGAFVASLQSCGSIHLGAASGGLTGENKRGTSEHGRPRPPRLLSLRGRQDRLQGLSRNGAYRLARLAAKFGPEIGLRDPLDRFSYDCLWRAEARGKRGVSACGVYLPDLEQPRPPDLLPEFVRLRVVVSND